MCKQGNIHALARKLGFLLFVKLFFLLCKLLVPDGCFRYLLLFECAQIVVERFCRPVEGGVEFFEFLFVLGFHFLAPVLLLLHFQQCFVEGPLANLFLFFDEFLLFHLQLVQLVLQVLPLDGYLVFLYS